MTRWDALTTICGYLRAELLGGLRDAPQDISWELIVEVASFHRVATALAACLKSDLSVPPDVRAYFDTLAELNQKRNNLILDGIAHVTKILNAIDIEPVLLKGASLLVGNIYLNSSQRLLGDVDILIPANRSADANAAMMAAGFHTHASDAVPPPMHHHLPMLRDPETGMGVELHTDVISPSPDSVISTSWFLEQSRRILFRNQWLRLPEPSRNAGHIIYHSEIFHQMYALDKIQLRNVLDLTLIRARYEDVIDWSELDDRFSAGGYGEVLATYLYFAGALFGQSTPALSCAPREGAMEALRNTESQNSFLFQINYWKGMYGHVQTSLGRMTSELESLTAERDRLKEELDRATASRDLFKAELARMTASRDMLLDKIRRVTASRLWRWSATLRNLISRY